MALGGEKGLREDKAGQRLVQGSQAALRPCKKEAPAAPFGLQGTVISFPQGTSSDCDSLEGASPLELGGG